MDISKLDVSKTMEEGSWMTILDHDGEPTEFRLKVVGQDSKIYKKRAMKVSDKQRKKRNGLSLHELEKELIETYAMCIVDQENIDIGKTPLDVNDLEAKIEFLSQFAFITEQVGEFVKDRSNFLSK